MFLLFHVLSPGGFKTVTWRFQDCHLEVSRLSPGGFKTVTWRFQDCQLGVSRLVGLKDLQNGLHCVHGKVPAEATGSICPLILCF